jgi:hypothetical protein
VLELEANHQRSGPPKQGSFTNKYSFPAKIGFVSCSRGPPKQGARGARAGPGVGLGYYQGARPPLLGPFRGKGPGPGEGRKSRLPVVAVVEDLGFASGYMLANPVFIFLSGAANGIKLTVFYIGYKRAQALFLLLICAPRLVAGLCYSNFPSHHQ